MINFNSQEYSGMKKILIAIAAIIILECSVTVAVIYNQEHKKQNITNTVTENGTDIWATR